MSTSRPRYAPTTVAFLMSSMSHNTSSLKVHYSRVIRQYYSHLFRLSVTNCAHIYNEALSTPPQHVLNNKLVFTAIYHETKHFTPGDWTLTHFIRKEDAMNGFFVYSLLLDKAEHGGILMLPHDEANQADRLRPALAERNSAMEGTVKNAMHTRATSAALLRRTRMGS
ncbi:hypothetical protein C8F04DRAFT_1269442 [Mycena alexandri]|uniref:Uncharacterized protein n=1 Tax=Mycena alexandri TaxID=1745969 RepID=A0AAD6WU01_9AGAR|nr:hypothetical protein C8F04DRAFT_1269442 [Mycena alexandri]